MSTVTERGAGARADRPLIVTLSLDPEAQNHFDALRREHFPAERNHLRAHVTLFHALPPDQHGSVLVGLQEQAARHNAFPVQVSAVRPLGRGVAYALSSAELTALRARLARRWEAWLVPQDRQRFTPHITVQNKVAPERARALHARLEGEFRPLVVTACGLTLWRYDGRPWTSLRVEPFHA